MPGRFSLSAIYRVFRVVFLLTGLVLWLLPSCCLPPSLPPLLFSWKGFLGGGSGTVFFAPPVVLFASAWVGSSRRSVNSVTGRVERGYDVHTSFVKRIESDDEFSKLVKDGDIDQRGEQTDDDVTPKEDPVYWFIAFVVPWCPHCASVAPEFEKASKLRTLYPIQDEPTVRFGVVDCTTVNLVCRTQNVQLLPTLRLYYKGNQINEYSQVNRKTQDFLEYLKRMTKDAVSELRTAAQLREVLQKEQINFLLLTDVDAPIPKVYREVAELYFDQHIFGVVRTQGLASGLELPDIQQPYVVDVGPGVTADPFTGPWGDDNSSSSCPSTTCIQDTSTCTMPIFTTTSNQEDRSFGRGNDALLEYVKTHRFNLVEEISRINFDALRKSDRILIVLVVNPYLPHFSEDLEKLTEAAQSWRVKNKFLFGFWDGVEFEKLLQSFDVYTPDLPRLIGFEKHAEKSTVQFYFENRELLTLGNIDEALEMILRGELQPKDDSYSAKQAIRQYLLGHWKRFQAYCSASYVNLMSVTIVVVGTLLLSVFVFNFVWRMVVRGRDDGLEEGRWEEMEEEEEDELKQDKFDVVDDKEEEKEQRSSEMLPKGDEEEKREIEEKVKKKEKKRKIVLEKEEEAPRGEDKCDSARKIQRKSTTDNNQPREEAFLQHPVKNILDYPEPKTHTTTLLLSAATLNSHSSSSTTSSTTTTLNHRRTTGDIEPNREDDHPNDNNDEGIDRRRHMGLEKQMERMLPLPLPLPPPPPPSDQEVRQRRPNKQEERPPQD